MNNIDRSQYDAERLAKREAIAARLRVEAAEAAEWNALLEAERRERWAKEDAERVTLAFRRASNNALRCHHGTWYDNCHSCQAEAKRERDAEAAANDC